ncbi:hypothetical protein ED733_005211 [Metarhizium rileyi]|uniref:TauD/TfdA-like domain-containing protein n=1 Tax=Metarhizium rileyi (strain RCEF 4871) TaxID=1649241 RepID=A0A5C6G7D9_METRR|nr:hypothetical protein ED733_005211 [Metarhizium rileyi]
MRGGALRTKMAQSCVPMPRFRFRRSTNSQAGLVTASSTSRRRARDHVPRDASQLVYDSGTSAPVTVSWTDELLLVQEGPGAAPRSFRPAALRDSCGCRACKDPSSGQKSFASTEIPTRVGISSVRATESGLAIRFLNDIPRFSNHEMTLPWHQLASSTGPPSSQAAAKRSILGRTGVKYWDAATLAKHVRKMDYDDFMQGGTSFWEVMIDLCRLGIVYLKNVPRDEASVVNITTRIANIRETFYGRTFDVRAKARAENVAYTSGYLGLHQDLCYLEPPPMIQVLHCMDNSCSGGASLFSDGERAGRLLWPFISAGRMSSLADHKVPYQYDKHGYLYHADRPVVDVDAAGRFAGVFWSPPFQGNYMDKDTDISTWIQEARLFESLVNDAAAIHSHKLEQGECVLFDNLRTMHGRTAFDNTLGERWLRGAYIAAEDFLSRAAHIPADQAEVHRGSEQWTDEKAQLELTRTQWWRHVVRRVEELDGRVTQQT